MEKDNIYFLMQQYQKLIQEDLAKDFISKNISQFIPQINDKTIISLQRSPNQRSTVSPSPKEKSYKRVTMRESNVKNQPLTATINHFDTPKTNYLTENEHKLVTNIGKLFANEVNHPAKIFVRLNTKQKTPDQSPCVTVKNVAVVSSFMKNIQQLKERNQQKNIVNESKLRKCQAFNNQKKVSNEQSIENLSNQSIISQDINRQILPQKYQQLSQKVDQKSQNRSILSIHRQVSLTFMANPLLSNVIGMKFPPQIYNKFRGNSQVNGMSVKSVYSDNKFQDKDTKSQTSNFTKLHEIQLFKKKNEIRDKRMQQFRHSNEKLMSACIIMRQEVELAEKKVISQQIEHNSQMTKLKRQLQQEKQTKEDLIAKLNLRDKEISSIKNQNSKNVKELEELRLKIQELTKIIWLLKTDMESNHSRQDKIETKNQIKHPQKAQSQTPQRVKQQTFTTIAKDRNQMKMETSILNNAQGQNIRHYNEYLEKDTNMRKNKAKVYEVVVEDKLHKSKSHDMISKAGSVYRQGSYLLDKQDKQGSVNKQDTNICVSKQIISQQVSPRSHKGSIVKNNIKEPSIEAVQSSKNLVRIKKSVTNDTSAIIHQDEKNIKDNKSLSNFSNISGNSLTQRVGYLSKPIRQAKQIIMVDYMNLDYKEPNNRENKQENKKQRFKLNGNLSKNS